MSKVAGIVYDKGYTDTFHSPGIEPWVFGFLKERIRERGTLGSVLDIGCGLGYMGYMLRVYLGRVERLVCVEVSSEKVNRVKALGLYDEIYFQDFLNFKPSMKFDTIIALEVLHGLDKRALDKIEEVGREDSTVILTMPYLPKDVSIEDLINKGYLVYRYLLRGLILVDLRSFNVLIPFSSRLLKVLGILLRIFGCMLKRSMKGYIMAFR